MRRRSPAHFSSERMLATAGGLLGLIVVALVLRAHLLNDAARQPAAPADKTAPASGERIYLQRSAGRLFGNAAPGKPTAVVARKTVRSRLQAEVSGLLFQPDGQSRALIRRPGQPEQAFRVGDRITADARISAIESSRVIIERAGVREELPLSTPDSNHRGSAIRGLFAAKLMELPAQ